MIKYVIKRYDVNKKLKETDLIKEIFNSVKKQYNKKFSKIKEREKKMLLS